MGFLFGVFIFLVILYYVGKLFFRLLPFLLFRKASNYQRDNRPKNNFEQSEEVNSDEQNIVIREEDIIEAEFEDIVEENPETERKDGQETA